MEKQFYNPELWGGIECTINRIGNHFRNQLDDSGHFTREDDIDHIADLGIKKIRYPVLWEAHQTDSEDEIIDWEPVRRKLSQLRSYKIDVIAGLVHHGSGPAFTDLTDLHFPEKLARYAAKVALEFPWIELYTPVNEPLTTARFSCLYGHWYPHESNDNSFVSALLNQLKGVVLSMVEIRKINPNAKLVQTEDLAKIHSTPTMRYQAQFENDRRWLTFDILCGRVTPDHPMWDFLVANVDEDRLQFFIENPFPPHILGLNYYVTSERYLDERTALYPSVRIGSNERHHYADVAAVRVKKPSGLKALVKEAWNRYHIAPALTEVHIHCTREEQLRWFRDAWTKCRELKAEGVPVKAVTAWSLFGAFDWNSLLTRNDGVYESGVFELNNNALRPTALAKYLKILATNGNANLPFFNEKGWWRKSYPDKRRKNTPKETSPLLIFGASGTLGSAFLNICNRRSLVARGIRREEADIRRKEQIEKVIEKYKPWAIINATGFVRVDDAETEVEQCYEINSIAPQAFAQLSQQYGIQLMSFSTDLVFNGSKNSPYYESDDTQPLNIYGKSKVEGETLMANDFSEALIIRTSAFFGPWDRYNFAYHVLDLLKNSKDVVTVNDIKISPTYVPHLVDKALDLLIDREYGIWHIANDGELTWNDYARELAKSAGYSTKAILSRSVSDMNWKAPRPRYSVIKSNKGVFLPSLEKAIEQFFNKKIN